MTDNEIKEMLEDCGCPECMAILDLINRQKAEIEKLQRQFSALDDECNRLEKSEDEKRAEIERLRKEVGYWEAETKEARADIDQAVADAIKDITGYLESEIEDSDKRISEFDTSDEERGYNKGLRVALAYVQEFAEGV